MLQLTRRSLLRSAQVDRASNRAEHSIAASLINGHFEQENLAPKEPIDSRETAAAGS